MWATNAPLNFQINFGQFFGNDKHDPLAATLTDILNKNKKINI
jgi:hypothetical protein